LNIERFEHDADPTLKGVILALEEIDVSEQLLVYSFCEFLLELAGELLHEMCEALL
jgi:hypothetical protein